MNCLRCGSSLDGRRKSCTCSGGSTGSGWDLPAGKVLALVAGLGFFGVGFVGMVLGGANEPTGTYFLTGPAGDAFDHPVSAIVALGVVFGVGVFGGRLLPRKALLAGLGTVALFPVAIAIECVCKPTSHNLLPFEVIIYGPLAVAGLAGAFAGRYLARRPGSRGR